MTLTLRGDKPILSSERMLHKEYDRKGSVKKITLVVKFKGLGAKTNCLAVKSRKLILTLKIW
jgi:hypothetical protein